MRGIWYRALTLRAGSDRRRQLRQNDRSNVKDNHRTNVMATSPRQQQDTHRARMALRRGRPTRRREAKPLGKLHASR
jgi:hypothetical protein